MFVVGQGVLGKIRFVDGTFPVSDRTYLVVSVEANRIGVLNVSSVAGKEHKLLFPTNMNITNFKPPFMRESFVKLDSLSYVDNQQAVALRVLHGGQCLNSVELNQILLLINPN